MSCTSSVTTTGQFSVSTIYINSRVLLSMYCQQVSIITIVVHNFRFGTFVKSHKTIYKTPEPEWQNPLSRFSVFAVTYILLHLPLFCLFAFLSVFLLLCLCIPFHTWSFSVYIILWISVSLFVFLESLFLSSSSSACNFISAIPSLFLLGFYPSITHWFPFTGY